MVQQAQGTLAGRVAVITGASSGIGEATAKVLAARGARVALLARRKDKLDALRDAIQEAGGQAAAWHVDVTDRAAVERVAAEVFERFGRVDILVNNAGIMLPNPIEAKRVEQWEQQIDLNIHGLMNVIGAFTASLVQAGAARGPADLVNISSIAARNIFPAFAVYSGTKAFVTHLSVHLRAELGSKGVRVTAIEPGIVGTELQSHVDFQGARDWLEGSKSQIEWLAPEDVAEAIAFTVALPKRVNLQQVTIMPTAQAS
ncbi:SDR family oxidoreductase [Chondromyces crocatus]|uniref:Short-chain dehydrogenase n=1 Tax=Chondromyces crocatus TaxID=52 RepID=A0A0K1ELF8_CHOCO|nr:SDR family oxidoreductase [Chondromyces crocatus]AKT41448.1 short-chain dehydrogenase [Chondromyces crocatus]